MAREKERFEILLEEIRDKVQGVAEGHETIRSVTRQMEGRLKGEFSTKIDAVHASLKNEIQVTALAVKSDLKEDIQRMEGKLDEHLRQPAHAIRRG